MSSENPINPRVLRVAEFIAAVLGCVLVVAGLAIIWGARLTQTRELYVSEMGAASEPTAQWFQAALVLIVIGGSLVAWAGRRVRSSVRILSAWTPAISLWVGCGFFLVASQVTCTTGCPLPYGASFNEQTFIHTLAAVLAFAAASWAMVQTAFARDYKVLAAISMSMGILVVVIAGTGGLLALFRFQVVLGSRLEFVATTLAISWLVAFGAVLAGRALRPRATRALSDAPSDARTGGELSEQSAPAGG